MGKLEGKIPGLNDLVAPTGAGEQRLKMLRRQ